MGLSDDAHFANLIEDGSGDDGLLKLFTTKHYMKEQFIEEFSAR